MTRARAIPDTITVHVPFRLVKRGGRKEMVWPNNKPDKALLPRKTDAALIKAIARAFRWQRMLESGEFTRVGGERSQSSDVRIVAASNRDLEASVTEGRFRADLLYRLRVVPIELPPLRDRGDDIGVLACHFLAELSAAEGREKSFAPGVLVALREHSFPGNVRELRNAVEHAFILAEDEIEVAHLPADIATGRSRLTKEAAAGDRPGKGGLSVEVPVTLADVERRVILATLEALDSDKTRAADALGISLKTLYSRLREYAARADA